MNIWTHKETSGMRKHTGKAIWTHREMAAIYKPKRDISWETSPADTLDSQFPELLEINFYCLKHPVCGVLFMAFWAN